MDAKEDHAVLVHYSKDKSYNFKECGKGLYYLVVYNPSIFSLTTESGNTDYFFLSTANADMGYFIREYI